jgi:glycosyltransferase involved in cell wall biosynthesis
MFLSFEKILVSLVPACIRQRADAHFLFALYTFANIVIIPFFISKNILNYLKMKVLSIVMPVFNEAKTVALTLDKIRQVDLQNGITKQLVIVNDKSTDNTLEEIERYKSNYPELYITIFSHTVNQGKGAALHTGIANATGDYIIIQDADLEYNPNDYRHLLQPLEDEMADVVYGSRFMGGKPHRVLFFWHTIGNHFLTFFSNMFSNLNLTDMETCYKVFRSEIIKPIVLREKRFGFEPEVTQKIARVKGIRIYEVGISYYGRTYDEGKKIGWKDGVRALYCIVKYGMLRQS